MRCSYFTDLGWIFIPPVKRFGGLSATSIVCRVDAVLVCPLFSAAPTRSPSRKVGASAVQALHRAARLSKPTIFRYNRYSVCLREIRMIETSVLIVCGGPVGLTLAIDLAWRGINVTVVELRAAGEPPNVKCNQVSARSMEVYRRLGLAKKLRQGGLPADYPIDVVSSTSVTGIELSRLSFPSSRGRLAGEKALDSSWPTPEPSHRINQTYFEPILFAHAEQQQRIRIISRTAFESYTQDDKGVVSQVRNLDSGETTSISSTFMIGCDGGGSKSAR